VNAACTQNPRKRTQSARKNREMERKVIAPVKSIRVDIENMVAVCTQNRKKRTQSGRKKGILDRSMLAVIEYQGF